MCNSLWNGAEVRLLRCFKLGVDGAVLGAEECFCGVESRHFADIDVQPTLMVNQCTGISGLFTKNGFYGCFSHRLILLFHTVNGIQYTAVCCLKDVFSCNGLIALQFLF